MRSLKRFVMLFVALLLAIPPLSARADGVSGGNNGDAYIRIKNTWQGYYLFEDSEGKVRYGFPAISDPRAQWSIEDVAGGHKRFKNRVTGHYLNSQSVTDALITQALESSADPAAGSDTWDVSGAPGKPGELNIISTRNNTWIVNFQIQNGYAQGNGWAQKDWGSATWMFEAAEDIDPVRIVNPWNGGYLYEETGEVKYGEAALNDMASQWFVEDKGGYKTFRNRATGHYLNSQDITEETITHPIGISAIGSDWTSDLWSIEVSADGVNIVSSRDTAWVVNIQGTGNGPDGIVRANGWAQKNWGSAVWSLEPAADSMPKRIKNQWKGTYLYEDNGQVKYGDPVYTDKSSQWILVDTAQGMLIRNLATGNFVTSTDYSGATPLSTIQTPDTNAVWKQENAKTGQGAEIEGYITLRSSVDAGSFINVQNQDGYAQGNNWAQATWGSAQWQLEDPAPPKVPVIPYIRIKNNWLQLYLYEDDNGTVRYGNALSSDQYAQWLVEDVDGVKRIKNRATGHYLNDEGVQGERDALKAGALADASTSGDWQIETYQGYKLISKSGDTSGKYVSVENKLKYAQYNVVPKDWGSPKWEFVTVADTAPIPAYFRLLNGYRENAYLYEDANGIVKYGPSVADDDSYVWSLQQGEQGMRLANRSTGHFISNQNINNPAHADDPHLDPLQALDIDPTWGSVQWTVTDVEGTNKKVFSNNWNNNWKNNTGDTQAAVIHVEDGKGYAQASNIPADWGTAQWILEAMPAPPVELPTGYIRIKNKASGQFLYENGNHVVLYGTPAANNAASHWQIATENGKQRIVNRATGNFISIEHLKSYLETTTTPSATNTRAQWTIEKGAEAGTYLIRSEATGYEDNYIHTEDSQGYAQYELRSIESRGVQWQFESAQEEAITVPTDNGPVNSVTPALPENNYVRITDPSSGKVLVERANNVVLEAPSSANETSSQWLPQDYNGRKRFVNRLTGKLLILDGSGKATVSSDGAALQAQWKVEDYAGYQLLGNASVAAGYLIIGGAGASVSSTVASSDDEAHWLLKAVQGDVVYEAKQTFMTGGVSANSGYATGFAAEHASLLFSVNADNANAYDTIIRYRNATGKTKTLSLYVNGVKQSGALGFSATESGRSELEVSLSLRAGMNTIGLQYDSGDSGQVGIDAIVVRSSVSKVYRGATVPFTTYEAEHGATNGTKLADDRTFKTFSSEASGREAVRLDATGQYVAFKTTKQANALVVRYSIPDSSDGKGKDETLSLYVNGVSRGKINLSSKYSWVYGKYPWSNNPLDGDAHRFFDESRLLIGDVPAGATVRLQKDSDDTASYYVVDLVELEQAPDAYEMPAGYLSVTDQAFGATANDDSDDTVAFNAAIAAAKQQGAAGVWIPAGKFNLSTPLSIDNVTIRGAGMWRTELHGAGFLVKGSNTRVFDLYMDVGVTARHDELREAAFDGTFGTGSIIQNVWIEHAKAGIWSMRSDEGVSTDGLYVGGVRIRDTYADGINFSTGTKNSMIEQTHIRNSGDDSIALWSQKPDGVSDNDSRTSGNTVRFNTIQLPWLADNIAIFGGRNNKVQDNLISDTVGFGAGIAISTRFNPVAFDGTTIIERNTLLRTGGREPNWGQDFGAIWIFTGDKPIDADIQIRDITALDSTYQGLYINGPYAIGNTNHKVKIHNYVIDGTGTWGVHVNNSVTGSVEVDNLIVRNTKVGPLFNAMGSAFELRPASVSPGSSGDSVEGGASVEPSNRDASLKEAIAAGKQVIIIDLDATKGDVEAKFTLEALKAAGAAQPNAVIVIKSGKLSYSLPANIMDILQEAGYGQGLAADATLTVKLISVTDAVASDIKEKATASGFRISGQPVTFELALESGGTSIPIHQFGKHFITRSFIVDEAIDGLRSSVVVYDPATGRFRTVPALFSKVDGHTVVTVKSATNSIYAVAVSDYSFGDIAKHWASDDITLLANKRIVSGVSANAFAPNRNISRAEFATLVVRALGLDTTSGAKTAFTDVKSTAWYASYVETAARYGIIRGMTDGTFHPEKEVTRAEMAVMLAQAMQVAQAQAANSGSAVSFSRDNGKIADWARSSVEAVVRAGIMTGKSADTFAPQDLATRAEAAVTLKRLLQAVGFLDKN
ncbi:hypothetical protein D7Z26_14825 [Cohnella endophytica]|uniref:S-layer homology domain-containing protein n=1 Tax=Cohnella endophytica TaxID=2419778 RepID=A0A494XT65_9BACL|nr:S-layer homology domain-containing protein [Cohnella endophytica]RKP53012.1 hypothetical protein D7Z26_14825 [Cohnella endophytica]